MSEIKPALTAEEWEMGYASKDLSIELRSGGRVGVTAHAYPLGGGLGYPRDLPALAALCLHEQPFGFTRGDVTKHRAAAESLNASLFLHRLGPVEGGDGVERIVSERNWHTSMADRIEALLPPEGK